MHYRVIWNTDPATRGYYSRSKTNIMPIENNVFLCKMRSLYTPGFNVLSDVHYISVMIHQWPPHLVSRHLVYPNIQQRGCWRERSNQKRLVLYFTGVWDADLMGRFGTGKSINLYALLAGTKFLINFSHAMFCLDMHL